MTIFITGATGKTGSRLATLLYTAGQPIVVGSRSGNTPSQLMGAPNVHPVKFDWLEASTYARPFEAADAPIDRMYIVAPDVVDVLSPTRAFIDYAVTQGVKRFVLLSGTTFPKGSFAMGLIHEYLEKIGVDFYVLRPTWFIENFSTICLPSITHDGNIKTTSEDGRVYFVSVDDIAEAAKNALLSDTCPNTDYVVLGPDLCSYAEAAEIISSVIGRRIVHKNLTEEEGIAFWMQHTSEEMARALVAMEALIAGGEEEACDKEERKIVGQVRLRDWVVANKGLFAKEA
ncbi:NAD(P)-binding protein [Pluteus cervinus]|uniref:NAD(P)-binding protein n=1 Tax=Pluteus cervinus TaxID=181527 RepID=A0ACD3A4N8_9AGAR|nr:NAD(P)-binding protein [Pluteus cervinus]